MSLSIKYPQITEPYKKITVVSPIVSTVRTFDTLQAAFNSIPAATDNTSARQVYTVYIPSGTYDEDLTIELNNRKIAVICQGSVALGTLTGSAWGSGGTARNLTITNNGTATINSIRSGISFSSINNLVDGLTSNESYLSKFRVSGNVVLTSAIAISSEFYFEIEVFGNFDTSGYSGNCNIYTRNSRYRGTFGGSTTRLQLAYRTLFTGLVTASVYSEIDDCVISGGMTVTSGTPDIQPSGIIDTNFSGVFTGPAASLKLNSTTNYWFVTNGASLAGGATKTYLDRIDFSSINSMTSAQLAGIISDETGSGSAVFANTPTLITPVLGAATGTSVVLSAQAQAATLIGTTSITSPLLIGGSANGQALTIKPTTGTGTSGSDIIFQVGNNGGTEVFRFLSTGQQKLMGGMRYNRNARSGTYQILNTDYYVAYTGTGGHTITMPAPTVVGETYLIKNAGTGSFTLAGNGANIFGASTYSMAIAETLRITYNGTIWETNN